MLKCYQMELNWILRHIWKLAILQNWTSRICRFPPLRMWGQKTVYFCVVLRCHCDLSAGISGTKCAIDIRKKFKAWSVAYISPKFAEPLVIFTQCTQPAVRSHLPTLQYVWLRGVPNFPVSRSCVDMQIIILSSDLSAAVPFWHNFVPQSRVPLSPLCCPAERSRCQKWITCIVAVKSGSWWEVLPWCFQETVANIWYSDNRSEGYSTPKSESKCTLYFTLQGEIFFFFECSIIALVWWLKAWYWLAYLGVCFVMLCM